MSINIQSIIELSETIEVQAEDSTEGYTAYMIWKATKEVFNHLGLEFTLTPQRFYNYSKGGKINGVKGVMRYTETEVEGFIATLVAKATK